MHPQDTAGTQKAQRDGSGSPVYDFGYPRNIAEIRRWVLRVAESHKGPATPGPEKFLVWGISHNSDAVIEVLNGWSTGSPREAKQKGL